MMHTKPCTIVKPKSTPSPTQKAIIFRVGNALPGHLYFTKKKARIRAAEAKAIGKYALHIWHVYPLTCNIDITHAGIQFSDISRLRNETLV